MPVGNYPLMCKKNNGKIVLVNLQATRIDKKADLIINAKLDLVFRILYEKYFRVKFEIEQTNIIRSNYDEDDKVDNKLTLAYAYVHDKSVVEEKNTNISSIKMIKTECPNDLSPHLILIFSGKRKSGKDYVCHKLTSNLSHEFRSVHVNLITLSAPLKETYAQEHKLDFARLLDSSEYKETYRLDMIKWSDAKREEDPFYFCQKAVEKLSKPPKEAKYNLWIVTDARRRTDLKYFTENYPNQTKTVRVFADEATRLKRNWIFTEGIY